MCITQHSFTMVSFDVLIDFLVDISNLNVALCTKKKLAKGVIIRYWLYLNRYLNLLNYDNQLLFDRKQRIVHLNHLFIYSEGKKNSGVAYFKWRTKPEISKVWKEGNIHYIFNILSKHGGFVLSSHFIMFMCRVRTNFGVEFYYRQMGRVEWERAKAQVSSVPMKSWKHIFCFHKK